MRKSYGNTWWGKQWLNALQEIDFSNRLPRGRTYANKGKAKDIEIDGNQISAKVQGSSYRPYEVQFEIPKFSAKQKAQIVETVIEHPMHLSELLNRKLPPQLMELCAKKGIDLFPHSWNDISGHCSCPDWAVPCKHMAAVLYLIANEIDQNPFLAFELHDFDLFGALKRAGYTSQAQQDIKILSLERLRQPFAEDAKKEKWNEEKFNLLDFSIIPDCKEDLLSILSEKPVFFPSGDFKKILGTVYTKVVRNVLRIDTADVSNDLDVQADAVETLEFLLDANGALLDISLWNQKEETLVHFDAVAPFTAWLEELAYGRMQQYAPVLRGTWLTWLLARKLVLLSAIVPQLLRIKDDIYRVRWIPAMLNPTVKGIVDQVAELMPEQLLFYTVEEEIKEPIEADEFISLISVFITHLIEKNHGTLPSKSWESDVTQLFFNNKLAVFNEYENKNYPNAIQLWLNKFYLSEKDFIPVIKVGDKEGVFSVEVAFQDVRKPTQPVFLLKNLLTKKQYTDIRMDALRDLAMLSEYYSGLSDLVAMKGQEPLTYDPEEFADILFKILPTIRLFGIKVILPKSLRKLIRPSLSMSVSSEEGATSNSTSLLNLDELLNFEWRIALGGQLLTKEEFLKLVKKNKGIVAFQNQYAFFDEKEIEKLIDQLDNPADLSGNEILQVALAEEYQGAEIEIDSDTRQLINELLSTDSVDAPDGLKATLRPYQQRGYEWLYKNTRLGFGSVIADDMGLGKTLQVITTLLKLKEDGELDTKKGLVIVPTTLLTNWEKEIKKFAPELKTHLYHGAGRKLAPLQDADVLITTYGVIRSEGAKLQKQKWLVVVIDEAQNIKNPSTAQTKAVKKIKAPVKIAMSGTPVENRMSEYWSIFDFIHKGYLKSLKKFNEEFAKPIETDRDQAKLEQFKKITAPFVMRRLKSDKTIIKDLPDKIEKDQFCELTPDQVALYQTVVDSTLKRVKKANGIERKGLVLQLITALKQVCNHPYQFLKKGDKAANLSGKTLLLFQLLQQILDNGEKTLIFTQYRQMGDLLVELLADNFDLKVPFLHGGVSRKGRDAMVDDFQGNRATRIMILSLHAGGTGLNLTEASNVIHYDLWWNPAVEAQATDRAYRIGQKRNVQVHRFITKETFEEKINELLLTKKELANLTVASGEKWIGEYNDSELKALVSLG